MFSKEPDEAAFKEKAEALVAELKLWEEYVKGGYVAGSKFTLAGAHTILCVHAAVWWVALPTLAAARLGALRCVK
jgi:hypothetical protein